MIKIYSTPTCHYCNDVKAFLAKQEVEFSEIDITENDAARKLLEEKGIMGVPVTEIGGEFIVGYDEVSILKALNTKEKNHD